MKIDTVGSGGGVRSRRAIGLVGEVSLWKVLK